MFQNVFIIFLALKAIQLFNLIKIAFWNNFTRNKFFGGNIIFLEFLKKHFFTFCIWRNVRLNQLLLLPNILTSPFLFNFPGMLLFPDIYFHAIFVNCLIWFPSFFLPLSHFSLCPILKVTFSCLLSFSLNPQRHWNSLPFHFCNAHLRKCTHTHTLTYTHIRTQSHTHTHTSTHTRTHRHNHTFTSKHSK